MEAKEKNLYVCHRPVAVQVSVLARTVKRIQTVMVAMSDPVKESNIAIGWYSRVVCDAKRT